VPVEQARILLTDLESRTWGTQVTDDEGTFAFYDLPPGVYTLNVTHAQYRELNERVDLTVSSVRGLRVRLSSPSSNPSLPAGQILPVWAQAIPDEARKEYENGIQELSKGNRKESIQHFDAAIRLYPNYASAYGAMGMAWMGQKKNDEAKEAFERALKIDENLVEANLFLGGLYSAEKRYADAEKYLLRARLLRPEEWRIHHELGEVYWRTEKWERAEASLREAVRLHEELPRTHLLLMNVLAIQEKYPDALEEMEDFLRLFPKDSFAAQVRQKRDLLKKEMEAQAAAPTPPAP